MSTKGMTVKKAAEIIRSILLDERLAHIDNRVEAWEVTKSAGVDVSWETFKRMRMSAIIFNKSKGVV